MNNVNAMTPLKDFISDIPAAFIAVNSELSPRFPKVISDDNSTASGKASGTIIKLIYQKNSPSTSNVSPLPINSSTYCHKNCIISTKRLTTNVPMKSIPNCFIIKMSNFLIWNILFV